MNKWINSNFSKYRLSFSVTCYPTGSHEEKQGGNVAKMVNFSERFVFWIRQSIVETQNLEERIYVASRVFEVMEVRHT